MNLAVITHHPQSSASIPHVSVFVTLLSTSVPYLQYSVVLLCIGGKLNLTEIGASATQGPENQSNNSRNAPLAIDGGIVTDNSKRLIKNQCAASRSSSSVRAWFRIDLQNVYLVSEVVITFYGPTGRNAMIRVGSSTSNDGNDNLLCGTVEDYTNYENRTNVQRSVQCKERLWGRYVNVQRQIEDNLAICEVEIFTG